MKVPPLLKNPVFYDIFGLIVFTYLAILASYHLTNQTPLSNLNAMIILTIAIAGLIVDGTLVIRTFVRKPKNS